MAQAGFRLGARFGIANEITSKIGPLAKMYRPFGSLAPPLFSALQASILTVQRREPDSAGHGQEAYFISGKGPGRFIQNPIR